PLNCRSNKTDAPIRCCAIVGVRPSGLLRYPYDALKLHSGAGLTVRRPLYESSGRKSKFVRVSSGSRPLKIEPSSFTSCVKMPAVTTPNDTWVASCQGCASAANGSPAADGRCG